MDVDPFTAHFQRKQQKREGFKSVLRVLVEGMASLVDGQRCFADEFGLSYGRVFHDELESFKGNDTSKVISGWLRGGEEGAVRLKRLFEDLAQHQVALMEAIEEVAGETADMRKLKKGKVAKRYGFDAKTDSSNSPLNHQQHSDTHQQLMMMLYVSRYAKARERMWAAMDCDSKERNTGSASVK